jgi:hypothetical protein
MKIDLNCLPRVQNIFLLELPSIENAMKMISNQYKEMEYISKDIRKKLMKSMKSMEVVLLE